MSSPQDWQTCAVKPAQLVQCERIYEKQGIPMTLYTDSFQSSGQLEITGSHQVFSLEKHPNWLDKFEQMKRSRVKDPKIDHFRKTTSSKIPWSQPKGQCNAQNFDICPQESNVKELIIKMY